MGIQLVPLDKSHLSFVMRWVNDPAVIEYFALRATPITESEELAYIEALTSSQTDKAWSVFDQTTGEYVGQCSINMINKTNRQGRLFMAVVKQQQGKGYASLVLEALKEKGFEELGLHKLWLICREESTMNEKYLRSGFKQEGLLLDEYFVKGRYYNMRRMAIINPKNSL